MGWGSAGSSRKPPTTLPSYTLENQYVLELGGSNTPFLETEGQEPQEASLIHWAATETLAVWLMCCQALEATGLGLSHGSASLQMCDLGPVPLPFWVPVALP